MRALAEIAHQVDHHGDRQLHPPRPVGHVAQPLVTRQRARNADGIGDDAARARRARFGIGRDVERDHLFLRGPQHGERAVRGRLRPRFAMVEIVGELGALLFLARHYLGGEDRLRLHEGAKLAQQRGIFRQPLHQDVARAVEGFTFSVMKPAASASGSAARSARMPSISGSRPFSRAIIALVRRFGL